MQSEIMISVVTSGHKQIFVQSVRVPQFRLFAIEWDRPSLRAGCLRAGFSSTRILGRRANDLPKPNEEHCTDTTYAMQLGCANVNQSPVNIKKVQIEENLSMFTTPTRCPQSVIPSRALLYPSWSPTLFWNSSLILLRVLLINFG